MIKWFCDMCGKEIEIPEHPVRIQASRCGKSRDDAEIGWSSDDEIGRLFCHARCAVPVIAKIKQAMESISRG